MLPEKKRLPAFIATPIIACIIYACKSAKTSATAASLLQPQILFSAHTKDYHHVYENDAPNGDAAAKISTDTVGIKVGNDIPKVTIHVTDNSTFFFDKATTFRYAVDVQGNKGKEFDRNNLRVTMKYIAKVPKDVPLSGYPQPEDHSYGRNLIAANDCKTCHQQLGKGSIPSFMQVSEKYWDNKNAISFLANKIITGGSGVWGQQVMSAHPQLSKEDAFEMVKYVLSVSVEKPDMEISQEGTEFLNEHTSEGSNGRYVFTATYTVKGGGTGRDVVVLRPSKVEARRADVIHDMQKETIALDGINNGSYFVLKNIDLKDVSQLTYRYSSKDNGAAIEVHTDAPNGQVISTAIYKATRRWDKYKEVSAPVTDPGGKHDLYFVLVKNDASNRNLTSLDWVKFEGTKQVKVIEAKPTVKTRMIKINLAKKSSSTRQHNQRKENVKGHKK